MRRRLLSILLVLCMVLALLPGTAWAVDSSDTDKPTLTALSVQNSDGEMVSLLNNSEIGTISLGDSYVFEASFTNAEQISKVYITSTKGGEKKFLETSYNDDKKAFVSNGAFDGDSSYIPGSIGVEYTRKASDVKVSDSVDWNALQAVLGDQCEVKIDSASGEAVQATVDISKLLDSEEEVLIDFAIDIFDEATDSNLSGWLGYYEDLEKLQITMLEGGNYSLYTDSLLDTGAIIIRDATGSGSKYIKLILKETGAEHRYTLSAVAEHLSYISRSAGLLYNFRDIEKGADDLRAEVGANSSLSREQREQLYSEIDAYKNNRQLFTLIMTVVPVVVAATGGTMAGPAIVFNALLGAISAAAGTFWDYRIGMISGCDPVDADFTSAGAGHGIPLTEDFMWDNDHTITQSGSYYLTESTVIYIGTNEKAVDVTLCLHGHNASGISVSNGSVLRLSDCTYLENMDGSVTGGEVTSSVRIGAESKLLFSGGIIRQGVTSNGGEVVITGGTIKSNGVTGGNGSHITVENGKINGGVYVADGEIFINGGTISSGNSRTHGRTAWTDNGTIEIHNGQLTSGAGTESGTIHISGGLLGNVIEYFSDFNGVIWNESGTLEIDGGTVGGGIYTGAGGITYINGGVITRAHEDGVASYPAAITNDGGDLTITGGNVTGIKVPCVENASNGTLTVKGGTFQSEGDSYYSVCVDNGGIVSITSGMFQASSGVIRNSGEVTISGGEFWSEGENSSCVSNSGGTLIISSGYFQGVYGISERKSDSNTLLIASDSIVEINATKNAFLSNSDVDMTVKAAEDYNGGVTYYQSSDADGIEMTIEQAAGIDFSTPYVRLVAGDASRNPDDPSGDCEHNYSPTVTPPTCTERGYTTYTCSKCGNRYIDNYTTALGHSYGAWTITIPATSNTSGQQERVCARCGDKQTSIIPATGGGSSTPDYSSSSDSDPTYSITVPSRVTGGTIKLSPTNASAGQRVTITAKPNTGYELDTLTVTDSKGNTLTLIDQGDSKYTFTMPSSKVSIDVSFKATTPAASVTTSNFTDVPENAYYADAVAWAVANGITYGITDTTFGPDVTCNRAQIVSFLWRQGGSPTMSGTNPFTDVSTSDYYYDAVLWAVKNGITVGTGDGTTFSPSEPCTRAQAMTFLYRDKNSPSASGINSFTDVSASAYYANAVQWAVANGVTYGIADTTFGSNQDCTRAQIVSFMYRARAN